MRHRRRSRLFESFTVTLVLMLSIGGPLVLDANGQYKNVNALICDTAGHCVGTETTGTPGVYRLLTSTSGGGAGGGTVAQGAAGATAWPMTISGITVTIPVNVTNLSFPVTQSGNWSITNTGFAVTNTTTATPVSIRCVDVTGTAFVACGPTTVTISPSGTQNVTFTNTAIQANAGTGTQNVTFTNTAIQANAGTGTQSVTFTNTAIQANAGTGTANVTFTNTAIQANAGTGTQGVNLAQVLGGALSTANPVISGGRAQTTTYSPVANAAVVTLATDKYGRLVWMPCAQDMIANGTFTLTATTASTILATTDTNTRYLLMTVYACNTSTAATRLDIRDNTTALFPIVWTQTTNVGEERCYTIPLNPPYVITASNPVTVALGTAVTDVRGFIGACKTGT